MIHTNYESAGTIVKFSRKKISLPTTIDTYYAWIHEYKATSIEHGVRTLRVLKVKNKEVATGKTVKLRETQKRWAIDIFSKQGDNVTYN